MAVESRVPFFNVKKHPFVVVNYYTSVLRQ